MFARRVAPVCVVLAGWLLADAGVTRAQTAAQTFDPNVIHEIRMFVNTRDLALIRSRYTESIFVPADVEIAGTRIRNVAIRSRGSGSRNPNKLGLRLDFNKYVTGRTIAGVRALDLDNLLQDPSMMREQLAMEFFARMGEPASRESYVHLFINGVDHGLYSLVEEVDEYLTQRTLGDNTGFLFEWHYMFPFFDTYLGDDLTPYKPILEAKTHILDADTTLYTPIRDMFREINGPDDAVWRERVEQYVDLSQYMKHVAIENYLAEWDGLTGNYGKNNFFLYRSGGSTRHRYLVWDRDNAMLAIDSSVFQRTDQYVLFRRAVAIPELRNLYLDTLDKCVQVALQDGWFESEVNRMATLITGPAHQDPLKLFTNEETDAGMLFILDFAQRRPAIVQAEVNLARLVVPTK